MNKWGTSSYKLFMDISSAHGKLAVICKGTRLLLSIFKSKPQELQHLHQLEKNKINHTSREPQIFFKAILTHTHKKKVLLVFYVVSKEQMGLL